MSSSRALAQPTAAHPRSRAAISAQTPRLHRCSCQRGASATRVRGLSGGTPGGPRQGGEDSADASAAAAAPSTSAPTPPDAANNAAAALSEDDVDALLAENWEQIKRRIARDLPPDQQRLMLDLTVEDLSSLDRVLNRFAEEFLGPYLAAAGVVEPPLAFFLSLLSIATALQLGLAAALFYGVQLGLGGDAGDGLRAVAGLGAGLVARIFVNVEQLLWPLYDALLTALTGSGDAYPVEPATPEQRRATLNKLGVVVAAAFLVPRALGGYGTEECLQFVLPLAGGLFVYDLTYLGALLIKLRRGDGGDAGDDDGL